MSVTFMQNNCLAAPGLAIKAGTSAVVKTSTTVKVKSLGRQVSVTAGDAPSLALASLPGPTANGTAGGTPTIVNNYLTIGGVSASLVSTLATNYTQCYTLCADVAQTATGTVSLYWIAGQPFLTSDHLPSESDFAPVPLQTSVKLGYVVIKNASGSAFTQGTTALDASGITTTYIDNYGQEGK